MQIIEFKLPENLTEELKALREELHDIKANLKHKKPTEYLSRNEVAEMLKINISSVHNWTQKGILQAYQCGGKIFFKRLEVEKAIIKLQK